jgi:hypothetical protein
MIAIMRLLRVAHIIFLPLFFACYIQGQVDFTASETDGCTNFRVKFSIDYSTIDIADINSVKWHFGFGDTIRAIDPDTIVYTQEGQYTVVLIINDDPAMTAVKENFITVHHTLNAIFRHEEFQINNNYQFIPLDHITDLTANYTYDWLYLRQNRDTAIHHIKNGITATNQLIAIDTVTLETGRFPVSLTIIDNSNGCISSYETEVRIFDDITIPNVFVPENHHFFEIDPKDLSIVLLFQVYTRYGLLVFKQESPHIIWDGRNNYGTELNTGVYYYILEAVQGDLTEKYSKKGFIHLFREY